MTPVCSFDVDSKWNLAQWQVKGCAVVEAFFKCSEKAAEGSWRLVLRKAWALWSVAEF